MDEDQTDYTELYQASAKLESDISQLCKSTAVALSGKYDVDLILTTIAKSQIIAITNYAYAIGMTTTEVVALFFVLEKR